VAHGGLGCARRYTVLAAVRAEGMPQSVQVDCATAFITLWYGGRRQVAVEDLHEVTRHGEQRLIEGQGQGDRTTDELRVHTRLDVAQGDSACNQE
jgi:hypothetical protein